MVLTVLPIQAQAQPLREFLRIRPDSLILLPYKMIMDVLQSRMVLQPLLTGPGADLAVGGFTRDNPSSIGGVDGSVQLSGGGVTGGTSRLHLQLGEIKW